MKIKQLLEIIENEMPLSFQEEWDHSGLQLGNVYQEVKKVLVTLNVDETTINQAINNGCNLIISHHPFLFHSFNTIDTCTKFGSNIEKLIKHDICVYSMHTNFDHLRMNRILLKKIGCSDIKQDNIFCVGTLNQGMDLNTFIKHLKAVFNLPFVRVCGQLENTIYTVSMCAGSGHDFMSQTLNISDVYVTGDLTYSHAMDIILKEKGTVIEVTHFIEEIFKEDMANLLQSKTDLEILQAEEKDYFTTY